MCAALAAESVTLTQSVRLYAGTEVHVRLQSHRECLLDARAHGQGGGIRLNAVKITIHSRVGPTTISRMANNDERATANDFRCEERAQLRHLSCCHHQQCG